MCKDLTLEDIKKAIDLIEENQKESEIYEDEFVKILGRFGEATEIKFKNKGIKLLNDLIVGLKQKINENKKIGRVTTLYGIPVIVDGNLNCEVI